jgi:hypothetical protein
VALGGLAVSRFNTLLALLAASLGLVACASAGNKLFESPCSAPCWYGAIPGVTTKKELLGLIPSFPDYQPQDSSWWHPPDLRYGVPQAPEPALSRFDMNGIGPAGVSITLEDDIVSVIEINSAWGLFGQRDLGLSLADALDLYGEPSRVMVGRGCGGDQFCFNMYLTYPARGIVVVTTAPLASEEPMVVQVAGSLSVRSLAFMTPDDIGSYLDDRNSGFWVQCLMNSFSAAWQGLTLLRFSGSATDCER